MTRLNALRIIAIVLLILLAGSVWAWQRCSTVIIYNPDGSTTFCQQCCDSYGNCTMHCF